MTGYAIKAIYPCPMDLSTASLANAIDQYESQYGVKPDLLIVHISQNFVAEELLAGGDDLFHLLAVRWLPEDAWMVTYGNMGLIYSEGA